MKYLVLFLGICFSITTMGCLGPLDLLGEEAAVENIAELIQDDNIADKSPQYDSKRVVSETFPGGCMIDLNKSATVTRLDIVPPKGDEQALEDQLFGNRADAIAEVTKYQNSDTSLNASMEVVNGALKPFNDGLYAAIELGVQNGMELEGTESYPSKRIFLSDLLEAVLDNIKDAEGSAQQDFLEAAAVDLGAALILAGESPPMDSSLKALSEKVVDTFFNDSPLFSKPIGFYSWNKQLGYIFSQDRFLQNYQGERNPYKASEIGKAAAMAITLVQNNDLLDRYQGYLALYSGLTNPFANHPVTLLIDYVDGLESLDNINNITTQFLRDFPPPDLMSVCQPHFALFPSSKSKETTYFESMYCLDGAPVGINYMEELITAIRDGQLNLAPTADSGWYDYQSYALETLLLPEKTDESEHLLLTKAYKEKLLETFKTVMTQNRETHAKQLEIGSSDKCGAVEIVETDLYPLFPAEPFPTFYLRSARAYRFLSIYLQSVLGQSFLKQTKRLYENGDSSALPLDEELLQKTQLLYGLHLRLADAVGMEPQLLPEELEEFNENTCRETAKQWLGEVSDRDQEPSDMDIDVWFKDPDVLGDPRVIVPVQRDLETEEVIYWGVIGVKVLKSNVAFVKGYEPKDISASCWTGEIKDHNYYLLVEQFAEIRLPDVIAPPTREEFRVACDNNDNIDDIAAALSVQ